MKTYDALTLFKEQLERNVLGTAFKTKVVVTPTSLKEKGLVIAVSLLKTYQKTCGMDVIQPALSA